MASLWFSLDPPCNRERQEDTKMQMKNFEPAWLANTSVGEVMFQAEHLMQIPVKSGGKDETQIGSKFRFTDCSRGISRGYISYHIISQEIIQVIIIFACHFSGSCFQKHIFSVWALFVLYLFVVHVGFFLSALMFGETSGLYGRFVFWCLGGLFSYKLDFIWD